MNCSFKKQENEKYSENSDKLTDPFLKMLTERFRGELPGYRAHLRMAPLLAKLPYRSFEPPPNHHLSSVLIPLIKDDKKGINILFTLRSRELANHSGQISFPGGRNENGESTVEAALRETYEEVGINPDAIKILGQLSDLYVPPSNSVISPICGYIENLPEIIINYDEVSEVIIVPFNTFFDGKNKETLIWEMEGNEIEFPAWKIHQNVPLWGATAMILEELLILCKDYQLIK